MGRARPAAIAVAVASLAVLVGGVVFAASREGDPPPTTTVPTTTTVPPAPARGELEAAIAGALMQDLEVPLTDEQATCVAGAFLDVVGEEPALALAEAATPLGAVSVDQRSEIVRGIVTCVPADVAAALLSTGPTTVTLAPGLPDDGSG
jgi:hypothetical protein